MQSVCVCVRLLAIAHCKIVPVRCGHTCHGWLAVCCVVRVQWRVHEVVLELHVDHLVSLPSEHPMINLGQDILGDVPPARPVVRIYTPPMSISCLIAPCANRGPFAATDVVLVSRRINLMYPNVLVANYLLNCTPVLIAVVWLRFKSCEALLSDEVSENS